MSWAVLSKLVVGCAAVVLCGSAMSGEAEQSVSDETLRVVALKAIFIGMQVSVEPGKKIDDSWPKKPQAGEIFFPDALANENVYRVVGKARNEAEQCASENLLTQEFSNTRQVRFRLFRWPNQNDAGLLAVLQYNFLGARPAGVCWSVGLLVHLVKNADNWRVRDQYLLNTTPFFVAEGRTPGSDWRGRG